ncbi:hypothetical protein [Streptococcus parasuis]|nr:hypothetical protein [Streptococcus parasuis]
MFGNLFGPLGEIMWAMALFYVVFIFIIGLIFFSNPSKFFGVTS